MSFQTLKTSLTEGIFTILFNRPNKKNAMSPQMMTEISDALTGAVGNEEVNYVILTGNGDYYSSGMDLSLDVSSDPDTAFKDPLKIGRAFVASFIDFPKLLIAIVNGPAVGIAFTTLGLCDLVYCSKTATFLAPFTAHGLSAEGCSSYIFPKIMGHIKAAEILQLGKKLTAVEAENCGLVTEIYEPEEMHTVLLPKIRKISSLSKQSIMANKKLIRQWQINTLHQVNNAEWDELEERIRSPEFMNTLFKFLEDKKKKNTKL